MLAFHETHARHLGHIAAADAICKEADRLARYDLLNAIRESSVNVRVILAGKAVRS